MEASSGTMTEAELRGLWADDAAYDLEPFEPTPPADQLAVQAMFARSQIRNRLVDVHADMDAWEAGFLTHLDRQVT